MIIPLPKPIKISAKRMLASPAFSPLAAHFAGISTCLNYHRIRKSKISPDNFSPNIWLSVYEEDFDAQIRFLSQNYICLSLPEAVELLMARKLPTNSVTITFDDGYKDNLTVALPILERYGVPATVFITTGFIDRTANLWWEEHKFILHHLQELQFEWDGERFHFQLATREDKDEAATLLRSLFKRLNLQDQNELLKRLRSQCSSRFNYDDQMMNWKEVKELDAHPLISIGAHTRNHPVLSCLTSDELASELLESKRILELRLGHTVNLLAYPIGQREHASSREFSAAQVAGFSAAFTSRSAHIHKEHALHPFSLPRIAVDYFDTTSSLRWKMSGFEAMLQQRGRTFVTD